MTWLYPGSRSSLSLLALITILLAAGLQTALSATPTPSPTNHHSDNWAVIVSTSKYWFNYRHNSDALTLYHLIKAQGIPDSNIILMLPEDVACTTKNVIPATVFSTTNAFPRGTTGVYNQQDYLDLETETNRVRNTQNSNLYDESSIEIDYKGDDVTVENLLRILAGRHDPNTPRNKRLMSNQDSNVFIYLSGHGGDRFLKFRDTEILTAHDLEYAVHELSISKRFKSLYLAVETCQAATLVEGITTPNVITSASSLRGENSYSHGADYTIGLSIVDKYTYFLHQFYDRTNEFRTGGTWPPRRQNAAVPQPPNMLDLFNTFTYNKLHSTHHYRTELYEYASSFRDSAAGHRVETDGGGSSSSGDTSNETKFSTAIISLTEILRAAGLPESRSTFIRMMDNNGLGDNVQAPVLAVLDFLGLHNDMEDEDVINSTHRLVVMGGLKTLDTRNRDKDIRDVAVLDFFGASLRSTSGASVNQPRSQSGSGSGPASPTTRPTAATSGFNFDSLARFNQRVQQRDAQTQKRKPAIAVAVTHPAFDSATRRNSDQDAQPDNLTPVLTTLMPWAYIAAVALVMIQVGVEVFSASSKSESLHQ